MRILLWNTPFNYDSRKINSIRIAIWQLKNNINNQTKTQLLTSVLVFLVLNILLPSKIQAQQITESISPAHSTTIVAEASAKKTTNPWLFLHDYTALYSVLLDDEVLGHATRTLKQPEDKWILKTTLNIKKYFIKYRSTELTEFHIKDNVLINDHFYSKAKRTFNKTKLMEQKFDWDTMLETGRKEKRHWQIPIVAPVFDRVSHMVQLRSDLLSGKQTFDYPVSYKGKQYNYIYNQEKIETITTKMGELSTIKLVRQKSNVSVFILWLCPDLNYLPVKIAQYKKDKPDVTLLLESIEYHSN